MKIEYRTTSIFNIVADAYVNPVNCLGISGAGLALKMKENFPNAYDHYRKHCMAGEMHPGDILVSAADASLLHAYPDYIVHVATKDHWKTKSKIEWVGTGLNRLLTWANLKNVYSIALPMLGCGLGGLDWQTQVKPVYDETFEDFKNSSLLITVLV